MNIQQFRAALKQDRERLNAGIAPAGIVGCGSCGTPLQESLTGCRKCGDQYLCSDCYFEEMGRELEAYPISALRVSRGA